MRPFHVLSCILAVTAPIGVGHAQLKPPPRFGLMAGINSSTIGGPDVEDASRRVGAMGGILVVAPVRPGVAIEPEVIFTMKGADFSDIEGSGSVKMSYVEVPVLLRVSIPTSTAARPFFYAGPSVSFRASCNFEATGEDFGADLSCDQLESQGVEFKSVDYGLIVGAGASFDLSGKLVTLSVRYDHSFAKIIEDVDAKHRVLSLVATLEFPWRR
jgi:hypothetical protein